VGEIEEREIGETPYQKPLSKTPCKTPSKTLSENTRTYRGKSGFGDPSYKKLNDPMIQTTDS